MDQGKLDHLWPGVARKRRATNFGHPEGVGAKIVKKSTVQNRSPPPSALNDAFKIFVPPLHDVSENFSKNIEVLKVLINKKNILPPPLGRKS